MSVFCPALPASVCLQSPSCVSPVSQAACPPLPSPPLLNVNSSCLVLFARSDRDVLAVALIKCLVANLSAWLV